jgi:hypothetical protein
VPPPLTCQTRVRYGYRRVRIQLRRVPSRHTQQARRIETSHSVRCLADAGLAADVSHRDAIGAPRVIKFIGYLGPPKRRFDQKNAAYLNFIRAVLVAAAAVCLSWLSLDTTEDIAVLGTLLLFGSLSLGVIVLIYCRAIPVFRVASHIARNSAMRDLRPALLKPLARAARRL